MSTRTAGQKIDDAIAEVLAGRPGAVTLLDRLCEDRGRSPLIRLTCKGQGRTKRRHDTGSALRFIRHGEGWTLRSSKDSAAMVSAGLGVEKFTVWVPCEDESCSTAMRRADWGAAKPLLDALVTWDKRRTELAAQGILDPGPIRAAWH